MTRILLVAGEASGDLHGSLLARELRRIEPGIELMGVGGTLMESEGVRILVSSRDLAVTGLVEVLGHLPRLHRALRSIESACRKDRPDIFVPIDYPDFNLQLAGRLQRLGIPIVYYISPQVWAWRRNRLRVIRRLVRHMIVIFPFELDVYRSEGIPATYVGHPLAQQVRPLRSRSTIREELGVGEEERLVALLPGSRVSEIRRILPTLVETRDRLRDMSDVRWCLSVAPGFSVEDFRSRFLHGVSIPLVAGGTYDLLHAADMAVTASGTVTLEAAMLGTPMIVVYKLHPITYQIARRLVHVPHIAMANLIAGRRLVPEFVQESAVPPVLADELRRWLDDEALRHATGKALLEATAVLKEGGAAERAARVVLREAGA